MLDISEYSFDNGEWVEILRIDNNFRKKLSYPLKMAALAQPWVNPEEEPFKHVLNLRFKIYSEIEVNEHYLALNMSVMVLILHITKDCTFFKYSLNFTDFQ